MFPYSGQKHVSNSPFPNEVGYRRGTVVASWPFFVTPTLGSTAFISDASTPNGLPLPFSLVFGVRRSTPVGWFTPESASPSLLLLQCTIVSYDPRIAFN